MLEQPCCVLISIQAPYCLWCVRSKGSVVAAAVTHVDPTCSQAWQLSQGIPPACTSLGAAPDVCCSASVHATLRITGLLLSACLSVQRTHQRRHAVLPMQPLRASHACSHGHSSSALLPYLSASILIPPGCTLSVPPFSVHSPATFSAAEGKVLSTHHVLLLKH